MALEGNLAIGAPASITTPGAGEVTRFLNTDFSPPKLYYKDSAGDSFAFPMVTIAGDDCECCCELAEDITKKISCAVEAGTVTMADFQIFINAGLVVTAERTDDGQGNTTCTVNLGPTP